MPNCQLISNRTRRVSIFRTSVVAAILFMGLQGPAHAYLDPGTGSMILQGLLAAVAAAGFAISGYWAQIKSWFRRTPASDSDISKIEKEGERDPS